MPNSVEIGIIAFCVVFLLTILAWAFFWPHKYHRYGMDHSKNAARQRSRTAGRSHNDVEMQPRYWNEDETHSKIGKTRKMPIYDAEKHGAFAKEDESD